MSMTQEKKFISDDSLARARDLIATMERGDEIGAKDVIDDLTRIRESVLYQEMGKLTRELHDSITAFGMDEKISQLPIAMQYDPYMLRLRSQSAHSKIAGRFRNGNGVTFWQEHDFF